MSLWALAGASVLGGLFSANSANKAADAQTKAAEKSIEEQRRQFDLSRSDLAPYRTAGYNALSAMQNMLGLTQPGTTGADAATAADIPQITSSFTAGSGGLGGKGTASQPQQGVYNWTYGRDAPEGYTAVGEGRYINSAQYLAGGGGGGQGATTYSVGDNTFGSLEEAQAYRENLLSQQPNAGSDYNWQTSPGYEWRMAEGQKAIDRTAAARGLRLSSATMDAQQANAQGMASQEFWNNYNALAGMSGTGQAAVNTGVQVGQNTASQIGNAYMAQGDARASGYQGVNNAVQGTMGNLFSIYAMNQAGAFGGGLGATGFGGGYPGVY